MLWPLERPAPAVARELRGFWSSGREVSLALDERASLPRVRGRVVHVAPTGSYALVDDGLPGDLLHVPIAVVLSVRRPHFTEPLDGPVTRPSRPRAVEPLPGQLPLFPGGHGYVT